MYTLHVIVPKIAAPIVYLPRLVSKTWDYWCRSDGISKMNYALQNLAKNKFYLHTYPG